MELALESAGWDGQLIGTDIHKSSIDWAKSTISKRVPGYKFIYSDIHNIDYCSKGRMNAEEWFSTYKESNFDIVVVRSLFTHMLPEEFNLYLEQISLRLKVGGKLLLTFFILNEKQKSFNNHISFSKPEPNSVYAVKYHFAPTAAIAYEEIYLLEQIHKNGLQILKIYYGSWTGRENALSYQDILFVSK